MNINFQPELDEYKYILFHTKAGQPGRDYLRQRNISPETAIKWNLGFSPADYDPIYYKSFLKEDIMYFWRKLNNRLIIPIYDSNNKLISLSGRSIDNKWPKYIHYPFPAKRTLFGLNINKDNIRQKNLAIITEGQFDVISAWQNNVKTITCSFGAHASQEHFALLGRYTNNIYIVYDSDAAGQRGMNSLKKIKTADLAVNFCFDLFPKNYDLDNWIQSHTAEEFYYILKNNNILKLQNKLLNIKGRLEHEHKCEPEQ